MPMLMSMKHINENENVVDNSTATFYPTLPIASALMIAIQYKHAGIYS